jgi:hypothetical protein
VKFRIPHGNLDQRLDAKSMFELPRLLDDEEDRLVAASCLCAPTSSASAASVTGSSFSTRSTERKKDAT